MAGQDVQLLITALAGVVLLVLLIISKPRVHPFLALLVVSILVGIASGMNLDGIAGAVTKGAGDTLGDVGIVLALGAMLGKILADSGATERIATAIVERASLQMLPWAMAGAAFLIGIPMFFEVGLVMLLPLIFSVARKVEQRGETKHGSPYLLVGVPAIAALATLHGMVPPHPGPLTAIAALKAEVGPTMLYGLVAAVPAVIIGGPLYARFLAPRLSGVRPDDALLAQYTTAPLDAGRERVAVVHGSGSTGVSGAAAPPASARVASTSIRTVPAPPVGLGVLVVLFPALLMLLRTVVELLLPEAGWLLQFTTFLGEPTIAMLIGVLVALIVLGYTRGANAEKLRKSLGASLAPISGVMLIIAGGGAFKQVLIDAGVGEAITQFSQQLALPALVLGWLISMLLSVSTGSATVGIVGAAGLLAPLAAADPGLNLPLLAIAIGAGSLFFNYANHAGFWLVKESFGMSIGEATAVNSVVQSIVSLVGLMMALLLNLLPPMS
ncbi:GntP family permease [Acaricomes phytoseiuli]|uniref:GntP family permease n=1 Tax=Acaricomes phytoseiuli TaxID=291968 RepID=UPI002223565C|nr:GntP family permease [Acaricomes phytoseiuli]MCW1249942.1 GntP family permease [Acaricomes phytoseiuli]